MSLTLRQLIEREDLTGESYDAIAATLNARPMVANPVTEAPQIPKPLTSVDELFAIVFESETFEQDLAAITKLAQVLSVGKVVSEYTGVPFVGDLDKVIMMMQSPVFNLSTASATAALARLNETMPDPSWQAQIPGQSLAAIEGLGVISPGDVQLAMLVEAA
jgi:hypothetical protein